MNVFIATKFIRTIIHVLVDNPPSVPPSCVPLVSVLRSRKPNPKKEYQRYAQQKVRLVAR